MTRWAITVGAALFVTSLVTAQPQIPAELQALADTETAFAKAATAKGIRDSFLEYLDDDAITFDLAPVSAKAQLRAGPSRPFTEHELTWEPRTGDVAASGELGWLTGPSTFIDRTKPQGQPRYGNYLSVWRRQPGGAWRVFIDVGADAPQSVPFAPGFTRFPFGARYARTGENTTRASLLQADRALNDRLATAGAAAAYAEVLTEAFASSSTRIHPADRTRRRGEMDRAERRLDDRFDRRRGVRAIGRSPIQLRHLPGERRQGRERRIRPRLDPRCGRQVVRRSGRHAAGEVTSRDPGSGIRDPTDPGSGPGPTRHQQLGGWGPGKPQALPSEAAERQGNRDPCCSVNQLPTRAALRSRCA